MEEFEDVWMPLTPLEAIEEVVGPSPRCKKCNEELEEVGVYDGVDQHFCESCAQVAYRSAFREAESMAVPANDRKNEAMKCRKPARISRWSIQRRTHGQHPPRPTIDMGNLETEPTLDMFNTRHHQKESIMSTNEHLAGVSDDELFTELMNREQYRAACGMFVHATEEAATLLTVEPGDVDGDQWAKLTTTLNEIEGELTSMWTRAMSDKQTSQNAGEFIDTMELASLRGILETCVWHNSRHSERHRQFYQAVVGDEAGTQLDTPTAGTLVAHSWLTGTRIPRP